MKKRSWVLGVAMGLTLLAAFWAAWSLPFSGAETLRRLEAVEYAESWQDDFASPELLAELEAYAQEEEPPTPEQLRSGRIRQGLPLFALVLCGGWCLCLLLYWLTAPKLQLEKIAFASVLLVCTAMIFLKPGSICCAWDEKVHREALLSAANAGGLPLSEWLLNISHWDFGYLPGILGALLAQAAGLDPMRLVMLGQAAGYALLCGAAVKHAPRYKLTFFLLGMLPLNLFQAGNVTYDALVTGGALLGTALWLELLETPGRAAPGRMLLLTVVLTLGTLAKPAYSLLLMLLWMLPRERFVSRQGMWLFRVYAGLLMVWCLASLALPGPYETVRGGDERFADASASGQIAYMMAHPLATLGVLADYSVTMLPAALWEGLAVWGDLGADVWASRSLCLCLLLVCPLAAEGERDGAPLTAGRRWKLAVIAYLPLLALMIAQYVVSTGVGADSIRGMQGRYIMPVLGAFALAVMLPQRWRVRQALPSRLATGAVAAVAVGYMFWRLTVWMYLPIWHAVLG